MKKLSDMMGALSGLFHDVDGNLNEIHDMLQVGVRFFDVRGISHQDRACLLCIMHRDIFQEQETKEKEYQSIMGKRPPNNMLRELSLEEQKHQNAHKLAAESNQQLHEVMRKHLANIQILMKPFDEVLKHIPSAADIGKILSRTRAKANNDSDFNTDISVHRCQGRQCHFGNAKTSIQS